MKRMFLLATLVSLAACGGSQLTPPSNGADAESGCVPGRSVECVGPGGCVSNQVCDADGRSFGPCACASPADGGGTVGVSPGDGGGDDAGAFSSTRVASALAQCNRPHGPPVTISTGNDVVALATGAWLLCPAESSAIATLLSPGFVLGPGGQWYRLVDDGNGGLTAATGVQSQGPWSAFCEAASTITNAQTCIFSGLPDLYLRIETLGNDSTPSGCLVAPAAFESSPRRMFIVDQQDLYCDVNLTDTYDFWLVPL
jgi:hypothetical protein